MSNPSTSSGLGPIHIPEQSCNEKLRLGSAYDALTAQYSRTVKVLRQQMGIISKVKYEELVRTAEAARIKSEGYRLKLETHIAEHGC